MITNPKLSATPTWPSASVLASTMIAPQPAKTSAKVPTNSAASIRASARSTIKTCPLVRRSVALGDELADQSLHALVELVADPPHRLEVLAGRVVELPVLVALARVDRAGVAAAHRDHDVGGPHHFVGQRLGEFLAHVDAELLERRDRVRVDLLGRRRAGRADMDPPLRAQLHEPGRHLAAPRVLNADKEHLRHVLAYGPLRLRERLQPLPREAVGEHGNEDVDLRLAEQILRLGHVAGDRLLREDARELLRQPLGGLVDVLLGDGIERLRHAGPPWVSTAIDVPATWMMTRSSISVNMN